MLPVIFAFTDHDLLVLCFVILVILLFFGGLGYWRGRP